MLKIVALGVCIGLFLCPQMYAVGQEEPLPGGQLVEASRENKNLCGVYSLYLVLKKSGVNTDLDTLKRLTAYDLEQGASSESLCAAARELGVNLKAVLLESPEQLADLELPVILHLQRDNRGHFVTLTRRASDSYYVVDPPNHGPVAVSRLARWMSGVVLIRVDESRKLARAAGLGSLALGVAVFLFLFLTRTKKWAAKLFVALAFCHVLISGCTQQKQESTELQRAADPFTHEFFHDFGLVGEKVAGEHDFVITNTTSRLWHIGEPRSTCGCMVGKIEQTEVPPGEQAKVFVSFKPKRESGPQHQAVFIPVNSEPEEWLKLDVLARLDFEAIWSPGNINFTATILTEARQTVLIVVRDDLADAFEITRWSATDPEVTLGDVRRQGTKCSVDVVVPADARQGKYRGTMRLETSLPNLDSFEIPYDILLNGIARVNPRSVAIRGADPESLEQRIEVTTSVPELAIGVERVSVDIPQISACVLPQDRPDAAVVRITATPPFNLTRQTGWLSVHTTLGQQRPLRIPIVVVPAS